MSGYGYTRAYLEEQRQQKIREEEERKRRMALKEEVNEIVHNINQLQVKLSEDGHSAIVHDELLKVVENVSAIERGDVDAVIVLARKTNNTMIELGKLARDRKKTKHAKMDHFKIDITTELERAKNLSTKKDIGYLKKEAEDIVIKLENFLSDYIEGFNTGAEEKLSEFKKDLDKLEKDIHEFTIKEEQRRYILKSLVKTMTQLGFIVGKPHMNIENDQVIIQAVKPSGRKMLFRVGIKGDMEFDLHGYEGRNCADDLDNVREIMVERFSVTSDTPQYTWKNPDRISKGSKDFPTGGSSKTMKGGNP